MFSEYASRFLAQSQSQISAFAGQQRPDEATTPGSSRVPQNDWASRPTRPAFRSFLSRGPYNSPNSQGNNPNNPNSQGGNPYQQTGSRFGFASHISAAQDAPLFRSVNSDFRSDPGDDDHDGDYDYEDDREAKDFLALQRSRRVAAASKMADSSENENDASQASLERSADAGVFGFREEVTRPSGFRSSWTGRRPFGGKPAATGERDVLLEETEDSTTLGRSRDKGKGRAEMVDVGLESQLEDDDDIPGSLLAESLGDTSPPAFQQFRSSTRNQDRKNAPGRDSEFETLRASFDTDMDASRVNNQNNANQINNNQNNARIPATIPLIEGEWFKHDGFFACAFIILQFALVSTFILVWLQTNTPTGPIGDTIYTVLRSSFHMLAVDTLVSIIVALLWLAALRSFVWPLTMLIIFGTPVVLISFSLYPFVASFKGDTHGDSLQDKVMRWAAVVPAALAVLWVYLVIKGRRAIRQAVHILEFSSRILTANPSLLMLGLSCLGLIVVWTWVWLVMFNRIFLEGHFSRSLARWVMSVSSWWLGAWFVFMHMWTVSIITGVQQAATAATVSQWYFHRNAGPSPPSNQIVMAAVSHATTKIFGSICESTVLSLLVRVPLLVLPGKASMIVSRIVSFWIPTPVVALTNPLTITFAAIHSQGLGYSAKGISQMEFLSPQVPTTTLIAPSAMTLYPWGSRGGHAASPLLPYRLAKTILAGTRYLMATALGFAGWVLMAKNMQVSMPDGMGWRGSAYAYIVGIVASFIGLYIMGTMEGVLSGIVDAVVVCYGSERRMLRGAGASAGAYCMEAAYLFGDRRRPGEVDDEEEEGDRSRHM